MTTDATIQGLCVRRAGSWGCWKTSIERERDCHVNQASLVLGNPVERKHFSEGSGQQYHVSERTTGYGDAEVIDGIDMSSSRVVEEGILPEFPYLLIIHIKPLYEH